MKILIAYDGSPCADEALNDLPRAGFPAEADAMVVSISEIWVPGTPAGPEDEAFPNEPPAQIREVRARASHALDMATDIAARGVARLQESFPRWRVSSRVRADAPAWGILEIAREWRPDLIVVGTHGRPGVGRLLLGSVSQKVLAESECSVRVARCHRTIDDSPVRIILGVDGSPDAEAAVRELAVRSWRPYSAVRVIGVLNTGGMMLAPPLGSQVPVYPPTSLLETVDRVKGGVEGATQALHAAGLLATPIVIEGDPQRVILGEAQEWGADAIFVGARGHRFMERALLGSLSAALATHAHCSVEVVRSKGN